MDTLRKISSKLTLRKDAKVLKKRYKSSNNDILDEEDDCVYDKPTPGCVLTDPPFLIAPTNFIPEHML